MITMFEYCSWNCKLIIYFELLSVRGTVCTHHKSLTHLWAGCYKQRVMLSCDSRVHHPAIQQYSFCQQDSCR